MLSLVLLCARLAFAGEGEVRPQFYSPHPVSSGVEGALTPGASLQTPQGRAGARLLPPRTEREKALRAAGLTAETRSWDELARDELYLRARRYPLARLTKFYPGLPSHKLEKLKAEAARD